IIGNPSLNHRYRKGFYSLFKTLQQNLPKPASMKIDSELRDKINALSLIGIGENQKEVVSRALSILIDSLTEEQQRTFKNQFEVLRKRTMSKEK
ncbi:DUF5388 domain-containing protein, partial [Enterococcus hirae]